MVAVIMTHAVGKLINVAITKLSFGTIFWPNQLFNQGLYISYCLKTSNHFLNFSSLIQIQIELIGVLFREEQTKDRPGRKITTFRKFFIHF